jgi:hypothetical protein
MDNAVLAAVAPSLTKLAKGARGDLAPGTYELDEIVEVRVKGTLKVGEDFEQRNMGKVPMYETLARALHNAGVTGPAALKAIEKAMREALEDGGPVEGLANTDAIKAVEAQVRERFASLPTKTMPGKVRFDGLVGEVFAPIDVPSAAE